MNKPVNNKKPHPAQNNGVQINQSINWQSIRLGIAIPSELRTHTGFTLSLALMMYQLGQSRLQTAIINTQSSEGTWRARYDAVVEAQQHKCTHILFIDTDQTFPPNTAHRLLNHWKPIVGCVIPQRVPPYELNARIDGKRIVVANSEKGLLPVHTLGTGIMLIEMSVFLKLEEPYFMSKFNKEKRTSEDESFCYQAGLSGFEILADIDLSREVGHLGETPISLATAYNYNQATRQQKIANA